MKNRNASGPASAYCLDTTAMPMTLTEFDMVSETVAGLKSPATAITTWPMYAKLPSTACQTGIVTWLRAPCASAMSTPKTE